MIKYKNILLIFIFFCLKTFGQTPYYKMLGDTTRWYVSGYVIGVKPSGNQSSTDIGSPCIGYYAAIKDSVYNGKTYKKFTKENSFSIFCFGFSNPPLDMALIREDSLLRKVYIVHPDSVNECVAPIDSIHSIKYFLFDCQLIGALYLLKKKCFRGPLISFFIAMESNL